MVINVDARGCSCPEPVIMVKKAIAHEHDKITVLVDNKTALEHIKRFADKNNHSVSIEDTEDYYKLILENK